MIEFKRDRLKTKTTFCRYILHAFEWLWLEGNFGSYLKTPMVPSSDANAIELDPWQKTNAFIFKPEEHVTGAVWINLDCQAWNISYPLWSTYVSLSSENSQPLIRPGNEQTKTKLLSKRYHRSLVFSISIVPGLLYVCLDLLIRLLPSSFCRSHSFTDPSSDAVAKCVKSGLTWSLKWNNHLRASMEFIIYLRFHYIYALWFENLPCYILFVFLVVIPNGI